MAGANPSTSDSPTKTFENKLSTMFENGWKIHSLLERSSEPSNSEKFQSELKKAITLLEDSTKLVSVLGVFSINEDFEEVHTNDLKYLLLPVLLGDLTEKLVDDDRLAALNCAEVYFKNYLHWCQCYHLTDVIIGSNEDFYDAHQSPGRSDLQLITKNREAKIARYKEQKQYEAKLNELKAKIDAPNVDDEVKRKYYVTLIKKWINYVLQELESIEMEKPILEERKKTKIPGQPESPTSNVHPKPLPLRPIIITRNELQKKIYGIGYPSVPTMTVDEFYEQRLKSASAPGPDTNSLMQKAFAGVNQAEDRERDAIVKEEEEERDDPDALLKAREWDDWKDDHRRGFGNRKNMG